MPQNMLTLDTTSNLKQSAGSQCASFILQLHSERWHRACLTGSPVLIASPPPTPHPEPIQAGLAACLWHVACPSCMFCYLSQPLSVTRTLNTELYNIKHGTHLQSCPDKIHLQSAPRSAADHPGTGCYTLGPTVLLRHRHQLQTDGAHSAELESRAELLLVTKHTCSLRRTCSTCDCGELQEAHTMGFLSWHELRCQHAWRQCSRCLETAIVG